MFEHYEILKAMTERAKVSDTPWDVVIYINGTDERTLKRMPTLSKGYKYRIKQPTIKINGFEVPEPLRDKPKHGDKVYVVSTTSDEMEWKGTFWQESTLKAGMIQATYEGASQQWEALTSLVRKTNPDTSENPFTAEDIHEGALVYYISENEVCEERYISSNHHHKYLLDKGKLYKSMYFAQNSVK